MTSTQQSDIIHDVDATVDRRHMLKHPFYTAWTQGKLTRDQLREYAKQYWHHILAEPQYVSAAHSQCPDMSDRQELLENLIEEERGPVNHPELWLRFAEALGLSRDEVIGSKPLPETRALVETYRRLCASDAFIDAATALYSYESQLPAVAEAKIAGLRQFYGVDDDRALAFFSVHLEADVVHSDVGRRMIARYATDDASSDRARRASIEATDALWHFLDGVGQATAAV